ncbi:multifunctional CCA addition/repair protein [Marinobacteraceae bacterium S3BR75-40.1]
MDVYLVGGAVRDKLLGQSVVDRDWVVVGATPQQMIDLGYQQVGADFPVFLHPQTKEEYALARTERKKGHGYHGFEVYSAPDVSLEDDLKRRDLTINAMAEDDQGRIVDPFNGQQDLRDRLLRHVSPAFSEDPLRILRVARFAARLAPSGFRVAEETLTLMRQMVKAGEADYLVAERVWQETQRALHENTPRVYFEVLRACGALAVVMPELDRLFGVPQPEAHHPEIDTGEHTLLSLDQACRLSDRTAVRYATLVHDLGKGLTPEEQWPRHHGHEQAGLKAIGAISERLKVPRDCRDLALLAGEFHTHVHWAMELRPKTVLKVIEAADGWRRGERLEDLLTVCEADARGRTGLENRAYPQADLFRQAREAALQVDPKALMEEGFQGKALGEAIRRTRLQRIAEAIQSEQESQGEADHDG